MFPNIPTCQQVSELSIVHEVKEQVVESVVALMVIKGTKFQGDQRGILGPF